LGLHGVSPFARSLGTHIPKGAKVAAPKSRHCRVAKRRSFWKGTRSLRGGRSPKPEGRGTRVLNAEPKGAAPAPKRWPSDGANRSMKTVCDSPSTKGLDSSSGTQEWAVTAARLQNLNMLFESGTITALVGRRRAEATSALVSQST
jgi:hypothetical protein